MHDKCYKKYKKETSEKSIQTQEEKQIQKENTKLLNIEIISKQKTGPENNVEASQSNDATTIISKSEKKKNNRKFSFTMIAFTIIIVLVIVSIGVVEENKYALIQNDYHSLQNTYNTLQSRYNSLTGNYNELQTTYNNLHNSYDTLQTTYNSLKSSYETIYAPSTLIQNGTIHWRFHKVDGTIAEWAVPIDTYRAYIDWPKPTALLYLSNTNTGETYTVKDLREYVQPDFFANVISGFTDGKIDKEFVQEVVNFKDQIVTYGSGLGDQFRWPAETVTEGRGQCGDTSILMASLFKAGESEAHYGLSVYIWYCDANHMTNPQTVNHAIVEVKYADGPDTFIETTLNTYYTYNQVSGWSFQV